MFAQAPGLNGRERMLVTVAAVIPDLDGLGAIPELLTRNTSQPRLWFSEYHHALHNLTFAIAVAAVAFAVSKRRSLVALLAFAGFHIHLIADLVGSRGPDGELWTIPYLQPFTGAGTWSWNGQWPLNSWQNLVITLALLLGSLLLAVRRGFSPVSLFTETGDQKVVAALRRRIPIRMTSRIEL